MPNKEYSVTNQIKISDSKEDRKLEAVIDTAAQVTLIAGSTHKTLDSIPVIQGITIKTAKTARLDQGLGSYHNW